MASRRSSDGFLARLAKVASAGALLPALAAAVVLGLPGCGGDDSSDGGAGTTAEATAGAEADNGERTSNGNGGKGPGESQQGPDDNEQDAQQGPGGAPPEGERESGITPQQQRKATAASMKLSSPAFGGGKAIPRVHTCDGGDTSPPLSWSGVPDGTAELVLFVLNLYPVNESLFFNWAVGGLDPSLSSLKADELPPGAVVGKNSFGKRGYSLCPPKKNENYVFMLFAIPEALDPEPGFDPLPLREAVLKEDGNVGLLSGSYTRQ